MKDLNFYVLVRKDQDGTQQVMGGSIRHTKDDAERLCRLNSRDGNMDEDYYVAELRNGLLVVDGHLKLRGEKEL